MAAFKTAPLKRLFSAAFQIRSYSAPVERSIPAAKQRFVPTSGTYPKGFLAGTSHAGVKASNTKYDDITLVVSEEPCPAAAVFTRNIFKAAPVQTSIATLRHRQICRGVVVNSGCANAVTGTLGRNHALQMATAADQCFDSGAPPPPQIPMKHDGETPPPQTLVMSTGVIGQRLPIDKITNAIPKAYDALGSTHEHWMKAAAAICTTDTFPKLLSRTFTLPSHPNTEYRIAGMTKGAGMIHPNMGTLLGVVCTDAKIDPLSMKPILIRANIPSFNCISIDGDTSTNDTVAFFANGAAAPPDTAPLVYHHKHENLASNERESEDMRAFRLVLTDFMKSLAQLVVRDGEGATKFVTIRVQSTVSLQAAMRAASSIATSALVKTALYGKDANWGRILCAVGYAPGIMREPALGIGVETDRLTNQVQPRQTSVSFVPTDGSEELELLVRGEPQEVDEARAKEILEMEDLEILVKLDNGLRRSKDGTPFHFEATYWTCDFSHEYVTINGDYRT